MSAERAAPKVAGYDVEAVRRDFPILATTVHDKPLVYLDSAASAQKPRAVIQAERDLYEGYYSNVHRGVHQLSVQSTEAYEAARGKVRAFLGARETTRTSSPGRSCARRRGPRSGSPPSTTSARSRSRPSRSGWGPGRRWSPSPTSRTPWGRSIP